MLRTLRGRRKSMNRLLSLVVLLVMGASVTAAPQESKDVTAVKQVLEEMNVALVRGDQASLERALADEYIQVHATGAPATRAEWFADYRAGRLKYESVTPSEIQVRVYGDTAVALYLVTWRARVLGKEIEEGKTRTMRVFVRRDGRWQCVAAQFTRLPQ
jgi:ketosteroid isomerase-like protein